MDLKSALDIIRPLSEDLEGIKTAYRKLVKEFHPDVNPDGLEFTKTINEAYEALIKAFEQGWFKGSWKSAPESRSTILDEMQEALNNLRNCVGLEIEICGTWLWIGGNTKYWAKFLKELKSESGRKLFTYAGQKKKWYWKPEWYVKRSHTTWSMDQIRNSFGSQKWESDEKEVKYL